VRTFDGASGAELANFFAYDAGFTGGVWVSAGPVSAMANGIATGADASGGPDVRVFSAAGVNVRGFFAYDPASTGGVRVALGRTAAGASVYAATGAGVVPVVTGFDVATGGKTFAVSAGSAADTGGVFVAGGDLRPGGVEEVVAVAGPAGQPAAVRVLSGVDGSILNQGTLPQPAGTVGVVRWNGSRAVVVADGGGASAYGFPSVGDGPSYLGTNPGGGTAGGDGVGGGGVRTQSEGSEYIERLDNQIWWAAQDPGAYARVTSVVSEAEVDGKAAFKWWYEVDNASVDWVNPDYNPDAEPSGLAGVSIIGIYHQSTPLGSPQNDWGWDNHPGSFSNGGFGDGAHWLSPSLGDDGDFVYVGDVAHFWYFTEPIPIVTGSGEFFSGQLAGGGGGPALVPGKPPGLTVTYPADMVLINANNDNWKPPAAGSLNPDAGRWKSNEQKYIPARRDFDATNLWQDDEQLSTITVSVTGGYAGTVRVVAEDGPGGRVKFWQDKRKNAPFVGQSVPADTDPNIVTLYVEGTRPLRRTPYTRPNRSPYYSLGFPGLLPTTALCCQHHPPRAGRTRLTMSSTA